MKRRRVLIGAGSAAVAVTGYAGYTLLSGCPYSPATLVVDNVTTETLTPQITVQRSDDEIYSDTKTVAGSFEEYENEIPIGCTFPRELSVSIETEDYGATTQTIAFPEPDPPGGTLSREAAIKIFIRPSSIRTEREFQYIVS